SYGMVELPKGMGRMKSREGTVVDADDLMEDIIDSAQEMTQERGHIDGMSDDEKRSLFELIGLGGLKYYLLKVDPKKKLVFDPNESIELNGNTGPFIQYAHARIKSLLGKTDQSASLEGISGFLPEEKSIVKQLVEFEQVIIDAGANRSPALIANYTYELVKQYNHFYQSVTILKEESEQLRAMRLLLSENVAKVIALSMGLLGVNVPERM
ncbi:MAG: arginine--tRNA ligase, partial [Fluviicola sp.]